MQILIDDYKLEYVVIRGNPIRKIINNLLGKPNAIIFLHGFAVPIANYLDMLKLFSRHGYDVYGLNFPGHGKSSFDANLTLDGLIKLTKDFIRSMKLNKPALVGYSIGGTIGLKLRESKFTGISNIVAVAPLTYSLNEDPGQVELGLGLTQIQIAEQIIKKDVQKEKIKYANVARIGITYRKMFSSLNINLEDNQEKITVIRMGKDKVINNQLLTQSVQEFGATDLLNIDYLGHDIYYLTKPEMSGLVHMILSHVA